MQMYAYRIGNQEYLFNLMQYSNSTKICEFIIVNKTRKKVPLGKITQFLEFNWFYCDLAGKERFLLRLLNDHPEFKKIITLIV